MSNGWKHAPWILIAAAFFLFVTIVGMVGVLSGSDAVGLVKIKGPVSDSRAVIQQLHRLNDNASVKAIVINLDCSGGSLASAQSVLEEMKKIQQQGKPIVVSVDQVCTGGGYYLASGADRLFANSGSVTGGIRVPDLAALQPAADQGRPLEGEMAADLREQFLAAVLDARSNKLALALAQEKKTVVTDLSPAEVKSRLDTLADGRCFSGRQACQLGLVDVLGNLDDAVEAAAKMTGMKGRTRVIMASIGPASGRSGTGRDEK